MRETVTTFEAADALPDGSIVRDRFGRAWQRYPRRWVCVDHRVGSEFTAWDFGPLCVLWRPDPDDPVAACLQAAATASHAAIATDKPPRCSQCGRELAAPACGPTHALAAHQSGVEPRTFAEDEAAQADRCRYCGHGVSLHIGRWCRQLTGAINAAGAQLVCCCAGADAGAQGAHRGGAS